MPTGRVIWWNVERFFGVDANPLAYRLGATAEDGWNRAVYEAKLRAVASVLRAASGGRQPVLVGLAEVEDSGVVSDIVAATGWSDLREPVVQEQGFEGHDITLLYDNRVFSDEGARSYSVHNRFATRDILAVDLALRARLQPSVAQVDLSTEPMSCGNLRVMVNHWPSRTVSSSEALRIGLADYCARLVAQVVKFGVAEMLDEGAPVLPPREALQTRWDRPLLVMGDFNDEPFDASVSHMMGAVRAREEVVRRPRLPRAHSASAIRRYLSSRPLLYNPTWALISGARSGPPGTLHYRREWYALDQVLVSRGLLVGAAPRYVEDSLGVFAPPEVPAVDGGLPVQVLTRSGRPRRFDRKDCVGVSDHLPLVFDIELPTE